MYGNKVVLIFEDIRTKSYRLLFKKNNRRHKLFQYANKEYYSYKQFMQILKIKNNIKAAYLNKKDNQSFFILTHHAYNFHGHQSTQKFIRLNLNRDIQDSLWLNAFGFRLYKRKLYRRAVKTFKLAIKANALHFVAYYNLACTYALLKDTKGSLQYLRKLFYYWKQKRKHAALKYLRQIKNDKDFILIRKNAAFIHFMRKIKR